MQRKQLMGWLIGTSLVGSGLIAVPASAQVAPNQSDITGTNIWNNTAPIFDGGGRLDPEILENSRRLSRELEDASALCCNASAPTGPRRIVRGAPDPNEICIDPNCVRLNSLVDETKTFLEDVNRSREELVEANRNRIW